MQKKGKYEEGKVCRRMESMQKGKYADEGKYAEGELCRRGSMQKKRKYAEEVKYAEEGEV